MTKKSSKPKPNQEACNSTSLKYEKILNKIIKDLNQEIPVEMEIIERFELAVNAWNMASVFRSVSAPHKIEIVKESKFSYAQQIVLNKMIAYILEQWPDETLFIDSLDVLELDPHIRIHITTIDKEAFDAKVAIDQFEKIMEEEFEKRMMEKEFERQMQKEFDADRFDMDLQEGFVNRAALRVQPLKPFIDWVKYADPEFDNYKDPKQKEFHVYLIDEENNEKWLKDNYDKIFENELGNHDPDGENWPVNRDYKQFNQWFSIEISPFVYDLEEYHLIKGF
jgi:hypothetical protein